MLNRLRASSPLLFKPVWLLCVTLCKTFSSLSLTMCLVTESLRGWVLVVTQAPWVNRCEQCFVLRLVFNTNMQICQ